MTNDRLLLLHGFTGSRQNWAAHLPAFVDNFDVMTVDIVGHGRSPSPPDPAAYKMERVAAQIMASVAQPITLLGYSMGGRLALYIAVHYPHLVKRLILESSSPGLATAVERQVRKQRDDVLANWIEANGIEAFVNRWETLSLWESQKQLPIEKREALRQQRLQNNPVGLANSLRGMGTAVQPSLWHKLPNLTMPILLIVGELDTKFITIGQQMVALMSNGQLEVVAGAGHMVHLERPLPFQQLVCEFKSL